MNARALAFAAVLLPAVLHGQNRPAVSPAGLGNWETPGPAALSPDGRWLAYAIARVNEENELRLRRIERDSTIVVAHASLPVFTGNSKWIAYTVGVAPAVRERLEREKKPVRTSMGFRNLSTLKPDSIADITSFRLSADGRFLAARRYPAEGQRTADLIVQNLETGERLTFGNVSDYAWAEQRALLAFTVETANATGNGVQLYDGSTGTLRALHSSPALYRGLTWRAKSSDLAVLRARVDANYRDTAHVALAWTGLGGSRSIAYELDQQTYPTMRVSDTRAPQWSKDGTIVFVGLQPRQRKDTTALEANTPVEKVSDVQVWHAKDVRLQRAQEVQERADAQATYLTAWHLANNALIQLATDPLEQVTVLEGARHVTETDRKPYGWGEMFGRPYRDVYVIATRDGTRVRALEKVRHFFGGSSNGSKLAWFDGKDYWSYDLESCARVNLTAQLAADFTNPDYDTPTDLAPPSGFLGWSCDDKYVLVYDKYDIWQLAADGSGGKRLTNGAAARVVYRYARLRADENGVDLSKPVFLSMHGERSKKFGYARLTPGRAPETLIFTDQRIVRLQRADSANVFAYTRERFDDSPDWFIGGPELGHATQVSQINPFQKDYAWGKAEVVDFTSAAGKPLQAGLYYPVNYDPARKYPLIVYTYERLSQRVHDYVVPSDRNYYNKTVWTANGYFVLEPDIVFRAREPGIATLEAVLPAVRAVTARGQVDSTRIGHIGHSWGGYEAMFLPTRTNLFAAAVSGAGISNLLSFNGAVHWAYGGAEYDHWETGQARMEVPPWEDLDAYLRNSPIAKVHELKTPMLIMTGDSDGTVDWRQSLEFYNSARRAGRSDVVMLLYPGEDHSLRRKENQIDYHRRILQWFGHYLKGEPAAKWIVDGMSWLTRKQLLEANRQ